MHHARHRIFPASPTCMLHVGYPGSGKGGVGLGGVGEGGCVPYCQVSSDTAVSHRLLTPSPKQIMPTEFVRNCTNPYRLSKIHDGPFYI